jgi:hypothetical protein
MSLSVYDANSDPRFRTSFGIVTLTLGVCLLFWYWRGIREAVAGDLRTFPAAFRSSPTLSITFAVHELIGYVFIAYVVGLMIYAPIRNLWLSRVLSGKLKSVSASVTEQKRVVLSIQLDREQITLPDFGSLEVALNQKAAIDDELRLTIGALIWVRKVEKIRTPECEQG